MAARLSAAGCVAADEEAAELVAAAPDRATLRRWVLRREQGEPLAWIVGTIVFCGRPFRVDPGVYVPRFETELLAQRAAQILSATPAGRLADLCTGSGAVAAQALAECPAAFVVGVDLDLRAVRCARENGVLAFVGDLGAGLRSGSFDVVTAVTPYVPTSELHLLPADVQRYEPRVALDGGRDGLDVVRRAIQDAGRLLRPDGWFLTEIGGDQEEPAGRALAAAGFGPAGAWRDADGDLRGLGAQLRSRPGRATTPYG